MEVLFISHKYPPSTGGMEKQSYELINGMKVHCKVHSLVYEGKGSRIAFFLSLPGRIATILSANPGISFIHYNDGLMAAVGLLHRRHLGVSRAVTLHGLDVVFPAVIYQRFIFPKFNEFDVVMAVSRATANACIERGIDANKIVIVNNGIDVNAAVAPSEMSVEALLWNKYNVDVKGKRILIGVGRAVKRKGFSWFIKEVMPKVDQDFVLLLIGPIQSGSNPVSGILPRFLKTRLELFLGTPSDEHAIGKLMTQQNIRRDVFRLGKLPVAEINAILNTATAFVMPNVEIEGDMEGFGLVCLEASLQGATIIAAASGGITDAIIHGKNGVLVPPGHIASWVYHLNALSNSGHKPALTAEEIRSYTVNNFSWEKMCREYYNYFSGTYTCNEVNG